MSPASSRALAVARPAIQILTAVNLIYALIITALLGFSFFIANWPQVPLGIELVTQYPQAATGLRAIIVIGILGAAVMHSILRQLLAIVDTVRDGDPFIVENARRLSAIAWRVLSIEVMRLCVIGIAALVWKDGKMDTVTFAPWLAVLMLFVLAGVFAQSARMRADLEGTV